MAMVKFTAQVDVMELSRLKKHLHHGQQQELMKKLIRSLVLLAEGHQLQDIMNWLYGEADLNLPGVIDDGESFRAAGDAGLQGASSRGTVAPSIND